MTEEELKQYEEQDEQLLEKLEQYYLGTDERNQ